MLRKIFYLLTLSGLWASEHENLADASFRPPSARSKETPIEFYEPWFTGPVLTPSPINVDPGYVDLESVVTLFNTYGFYNDTWGTQRIDTIWAVSPFLDAQIGITHHIGMELQIPFITNMQRGKVFSHFQDINVLFGVQILKNTRNSWIPDLRLSIQETFPTGRYQKLTGSQQAIQSTGAGSFQTGPVLAICKKLYFAESALSIGGGITYLIPTSVHVKGFNSYGGGHKTRGTVKPGQNVSTIFASEYSVSQHWVFAFEAECFVRGTCRFKGKPGKTDSGHTASVGLPPLVQFSIAPEIEYVFTETSGILAGLWFSIAGKNAPAFASLFVAYDCVF